MVIILGLTVIMRTATLVNLSLPGHLLSDKAHDFCNIEIVLVLFCYYYCYYYDYILRVSLDPCAIMLFRATSVVPRV